MPVPSLMHRMWSLLVAGAFVAGTGFIATPAAVAATTNDDSTVTWSVRPGSETEADGRAWVELELDPGERAVEHMVVGNSSSEEVTFRLSAADGYITETGRFNMLPSDTPSVEAGTWIQVPATVTVPAGGNTVVPFTVEAPKNAEPGDHAAGVAASILSRSRDSSGSAQVGVESRVGFRVMTRITGELAPAAEITSSSADYTTSWNPLQPGELTSSVVVANTGNTRLQLSGDVTAGGIETSLTDPTAAAVQELLPGESRTFLVDVGEMWPFGLIPTDISVGARPITGTTQPIMLSSTVQAWAIPWPQLLITVGLALLLIALLHGRRTGRRRVEMLIEQAREEGRHSAQYADAGRTRS